MLYCLTRYRIIVWQMLLEMDVQILLDREVPTYTNLDVLSGRVVVNLPNSTSISSIAARLEGESTLKLPSSGGGGSPRQWPSKARRVSSQSIPSDRGVGAIQSENS